MLNFPFALSTLTRLPSSIRSIPASHSGITIFKYSPSISEMPREHSRKFDAPAPIGIRNTSLFSSFWTGPCSENTSSIPSFSAGNTPQTQILDSAGTSRQFCGDAQPLRQEQGVDNHVHADRGNQRQERAKEDRSRSNRK